MWFYRILRVGGSGGGGGGGEGQDCCDLILCSLRNAVEAIAYKVLLPLQPQRNTTEIEESTAKISVNTTNQTPSHNKQPHTTQTEHITETLHTHVHTHNVNLY